MTWELINADVIQGLRRLPEQFVLFTQVFNRFLALRQFRFRLLGVVHVLLPLGLAQGLAAS